jgi:exopolysaccharide biosynthesis polyprenyl glycosylphosphotransferase
MKSSWNLPKGVLGYIISDYLTAILAWGLFVLYRRVSIEERPFFWELFQTPSFLYGVAIVPIVWIMIHVIFDSYRSIYRMSRLSELARTFATSFFGTLFLFFAILLDDLVNYQGGYQGYYLSFLGLMLIHFVLTAFVRMLILTRASQRIKKGKFSFNTIFIGQHPKLTELYQDIENRTHSLGYKILGFVNTHTNATHPLSHKLDSLGNLKQLHQIINNNAVEEVIIALSTKEHHQLKNILGILDQHSHKIIIKVLPDMYDILLGKVQMANVYGAVLIEIKTQFIPVSLRIIKRTIDLVVSSLVLLLCSPLYLFVAVKVRLSSKGPIFYKQERIGKHGVPFLIYKFRSMYTDAEKLGPQLSSDSDDRCTPWGKTMRKYRLDEIPQFWNVLKGDMSLVGPRPERQFYIDQIAEKAPHVHQLHKVRPGITSWGQVKYGYASNVDEMVQRLKIDILYIENLSLGLDIKILFYTVLVILKGSGK